MMTIEQATAAERERCAKIVDAVAAECQRHIDARNNRKQAWDDAGIRLHARQNGAVLLAILIRQPPVAPG